MKVQENKKGKNDEGMKQGKGSKGEERGEKKQGGQYEERYSQKSMREQQMDTD